MSSFVFGLISPPRSGRIFPACRPPSALCRGSRRSRTTPAVTENGRFCCQRRRDKSAGAPRPARLHSLALLGREDLEGVVGGASDLGIRIRGEATQLWLEARSTDIGGDEQDDGQMLASSNRLGHE